MKHLKGKKAGKRVIKNFKASVKDGLEIPVGESYDAIEAWATDYISDKNFGTTDVAYAKEYARFEISNHIKSIFV